MKPESKQIRKKNHLRNGYFDYDSRTVDVLLDEGVISAEVESHLSDLGYGVRNTEMLDLDKLHHYGGLVRQRADSLLRHFYLNLQLEVDRERLIEVSREENPELVRDLQSGRDIKEILNDQFHQIIEKQGSITNYALLEYLEKETTREPGVIQLTLLNDHNLVAPLQLSLEQFIGRRMMGLSYHPVGRKGKVFGLTGVLSTRNNQNKKYFVVVNNWALKSGNVDNYTKEILNHEIVGHGIMNLDDHNGMDPRACVMATKKSTVEYVAAAKNFKGLYFCEDCKKRS